VRSIEPLAQDHVPVYESPSPESIHAYTPGLARLDDGRLVLTMDLGGPGVGDLPGPRHQPAPGGKAWQGKVFTSDDGGRTWTHRGDHPFFHARPFVAGDSLYVLGQPGDLAITRSDDRGETWSDPARLTHGEHWHQSACNVWHDHNCVYLVMERRTRQRIRGWAVGDFAPVLMRGRTTDDLTRRENWTFADELPFYDAVDESQLDYFGVPFYDVDPERGQVVAEGRHCAPMGWLETNVVRIVDPEHIWHDPTGRTFHLWMRAHTGHTGYAAIAKVVEQGDRPGTGAMHTELVFAPSGRRMLYVPCPGGQMRFHVLHDEPTGLYWLLSTQATDSMRRPDRLPEGRYNLPNNERRRLALHFSKNMVDWCFAGLVAAGPADHASRHYASMIVDGDDLHVASRSGDERAKNAHDGNLITFHTIRDFRGLVY
jgi:hypothetical protein